MPNFRPGEPVSFDNPLPIESPFLGQSLGLNSSLQSVQKFGGNPGIASATTEDIWDGSSTYGGFITVADNLRIKSGGNAADDTAGAGARTVVVIGLDENWTETTETIVTAGASASSTTTASFIRVYRAYVEDVGTYGAANTGNIVIEDTSANALAQINAGKGQTQMMIYTVPAGWQALIRRINAYVEGSKPADVDFYQRRNADDVTAPFTAKRIFYNFPQLTGFTNVNFSSYIGPFPAKTDIWASGTAASGSSPPVSADVDFILVAE